MLANRNFRRARTTNATDTSFASKIYTTTEPSGAGVWNLNDTPGSGAVVPCHVLVVPFGTGDADDVFDMRVIGWRRIGSGLKPDVAWVPTILFSLTCTMGTHVGVALSPVVATEFFADTIVVLSEPTVTADVTRAGTVEVYSPANNTVAWAMGALRGCEKVEFTFDATTNDPSGTNCLFAFV